MSGDRFDQFAQSLVELEVEVGLGWGREFWVWLRISVFIVFCGVLNCFYSLREISGRLREIERMDLQKRVEVEFFIRKNRPIARLRRPIVLK